MNTYSVSMRIACFALLLSACPSLGPVEAEAQLSDFVLSGLVSRDQSNRNGLVSLSLERKDGRCPHFQSEVGSASTYLGQDFRGTANGVRLDVLSNGRYPDREDGLCFPPTLTVGVAELWPAIEAAGGRLTVTIKTARGERTWTFENLAQPGTFGPSSIVVDRWDGAHPVPLTWVGPLALTGIIAWQPNIKDDHYLASSEPDGNLVTLTPKTFVDVMPSYWVPAAEGALKPGDYPLSLQAFFTSSDLGGQGEVAFSFTQPITITVLH